MLGPNDVDDVRALALARRAGAAAEVLRAAAELELRLIARLPPIEDAALAALREATASLDAVAPGPRDVFVVRPLPRRGRAFGRKIYVGAPGVAGADATHLAWQVMHEATIEELVSERAPTSHAEIERRALVRLRSRARARGLADAHGRWFATLDLSGLGPIPDVEDAPE